MIKTVVFMGVCLAFYTMGFMSGSLHYKNKLLAAEKTAAQQLNQANQQYRQKEQQYQQISDALAAQQADYQQAQNDFKQRLNKELQRYDELHANQKTSDHTANSACTHLDAHWVRLHDSAATGRLPENSAATRSATASTSAAIHTITDNYNQCRNAIEKLTAWQAWWQQINEAQHGQTQ